MLHFFHHVAVVQTDGWNIFIMVSSNYFLIWTLKCWETGRWIERFTPQFNGFFYSKLELIFEKVIVGVTIKTGQRAREREKKNLSTPYGRIWGCTIHILLYKVHCAIYGTTSLENGNTCTADTDFKVQVKVISDLKCENQLCQRDMGVYRVRTIN